MHSRSMRKIYPIALICLVFMVSACADKTICPAFQSYYLLDEDKRDVMFSYFGEDSLPKQQEGIVSKNMFGIIEKPNYFTVGSVAIPKNEYKERNADMQTIRMEVIYPSDEEDSLNLSGVVPDSSQATNQYESDVNFDLPDYSDVFDTIATQKDTAKIKPEYHYNIDQLYYMDLIGDEIMEGRQDRMDSLKSQREEQEANGSPVEPEVKQSFFKRLFGGKKNKQSGEDGQTDGASLSQEEFDPNQTEPETEKKPKEKKGLKKFFGKKEKKEETEVLDPGGD